MKKSLGASTLVYPTPVWVIGSYDENGRANMMTAAWGGVCCSKPPCVAVSLREATYTHGCIMACKAFTVNIGGENYAEQIDYFGICSGRNVDKIRAVELTATRSTLVDAPFLEEFPLILECRLKQVVEIGLHTQFIGEIVDVKADADILGDKDVPEIEKLRPLLFSPGLRRYHGVGAAVGEAFSMGKKFRQQ